MGKPARTCRIFAPTSSEAELTTTLGAFARENRKVLRLNQQEVADLAEVSERFVREFEAGKETVQLNKVVAVLRVLGFDLVPQIHRPTDA